MKKRFSEDQIVAILREGRVVNLKRVRRLCREHGLMLKQKRKRKRRGIGIGVPCMAERPGHVWAYDFVEDRTETGRKLRVLTVADEFTRECVTVEGEYRMNAKFVADTLLRLFGERGAPEFVRSDNGAGVHRRASDEGSGRHRGGGQAHRSGQSGGRTAATSGSMGRCGTSV